MLARVSLTILFAITCLTSTFASTDYGPAIYRPMSCTKWYTSGNGHHFCVIHDMEGYYWTTISYLNRCDLKTDGSGNFAVSTSIHYLVNGLDNGSDEDGHRENNSSDPAAGEITQSVRESNYAWHAVCWNTWSWGTEHEGFASSPAWYTEAMYVASSGLQRHLMQKTTHPIDRNHIIGHDEKKTAAWVTWLKANYPSMSPTCNSHTDPGVYWNWTRFMALVAGGPAAPTNLVVAPLSVSQIKLTWTDASTNETGFKIERGTSTSGPWTQIATTAANTTSYTNSGLVASTVYSYRVRSYNADGDSDYSNIRSATTGNSAPILTAIGNKTVSEGSLLTFTAKATDAGLGATTLLTDFEAFSAGTINVMFQKPSYSGSSRGVDTSATNYTQIVSSATPAGTGKGAAILKSSWSFLAGTTNYVRMTTTLSAGFPNPVINFKQILKFDIYCDKALKVGVGCRETTNAASTAIGADGGGSGPIEFAGVTNLNNGTPMPTRTIAANTWTTLQFNLPFEPITPFFGVLANGVLSTASGLGVMENLVFVPVATTAGTYNVYMDNFSVVYSNLLTFSLGAGSPAGASINPNTGVFTWTPTEAQGPGDYDITIRVTDMGSPALDDFETITVTVNEVNNAPPTLTTISNQVVVAGNLLTVTNSASDADLPVELTFSLDAGAPETAGIDPISGIFTWTPPSDSTDSTNSITVRVTDSGIPSLFAAKTFSVRVVSRMATATQPDAEGNMSISWSSIPGRKYRVQFKNDLSEATWTDVGGDITAIGTSSKQMIPVGTTGQRFYRIAEMP